MLSDAQLDNIRRGDTSQIEALVQEVRLLRDTDALVKGLYKAEADLADARAEVEQVRIERDNWQLDTERQINNAQFYRGIVIRIGELFGDAAKVQDDGGMAEGVLCLKVPDLVERLKRENEALRKEHEAAHTLDWEEAHRAAQAVLVSKP